jgi:hypothetical protein
MGEGARRGGLPAELARIIGISYLDFFDRDGKEPCDR